MNGGVTASRRRTPCHRLERSVPTIERGKPLRLFNRAKQPDPSTPCPGCGERIPEGALACSMCGHDLEAQHSIAQAPGAEERELGRRWA